MRRGDFEEDDRWQREQRDVLLAPKFYQRYATEGRYVFLDKGRLSKALQRLAVDTIVQGKDGDAICIEEKIVRWPGYTYSDYALETDSCTVKGRESQGWMHYGRADYLLYCFQTSSGDLKCHLMSFRELKTWFWPRSAGFKTFGPLDTLNRSAGRKVPINQVEKATKVHRFFVDGDPRYVDPKYIKVRA